MKHQSKTASRQHWPAAYRGAFERLDSALAKNTADSRGRMRVKPFSEGNEAKWRAIFGMVDPEEQI